MNKEKTTIYHCKNGSVIEEKILISKEEHLAERQLFDDSDDIIIDETDNEIIQPFDDDDDFLWIDK